MKLCDTDPRGSALPAALFLAAMLALVGAALHLAVQTEQRLAVNCLESERARFAAVSALRLRTARLRQALARFRVPHGATTADAESYRNDFLSGQPDRVLSLLEDGIPQLESRFGPFTLDLPLGQAPWSPLDPLARCRAACFLEPAGVSGSPANGLAFTYRCRVTGEGRSRPPGRGGEGIAYCREEILFTILLARFPRSHWQLCLPACNDDAGGPRLHLQPLRFAGPVRMSGCPGFSGTGQSCSGLPRFDSAFLTSRDDRSCWSLTAAADPRFSGRYPCRLKKTAPLPAPGDLARASLGLPPGSDSRLGGEELLAALDLPAGSGRPPAGVYMLRNGELTGGIYVEGDLALLEIRGEGRQQVLRLQTAGSLLCREVRVDRQQQTTWVDGIPFPGVLEGPLFVEGRINALDSGAVEGGPVPPALAPGVAITVAASGDLVLSGHLLYADSPQPLPGPRAIPPEDGRLLGLYSAGRRADGSAAGGQGIILRAPAGGRLCLDAVLAVGGERRGVRTTGTSGAVIFGALTVDRLVQPRLFSRLGLTYDSRLADPAFHPPCWPAGPSFEAYLASCQVCQRQEISPYG